MAQNTQHIIILEYNHTTSFNNTEQQHTIIDRQVLHFLDKYYMVSFSVRQTRFQLFMTEQIVGHKLTVTRLQWLVAMAVLALPKSVILVGSLLFLAANVRVAWCLEQNAESSRDGRSGSVGDEASRMGQVQWKFNIKK